MLKNNTGFWSSPAVFVLLSFVFGLANFVDTFLRLMFSYMMPFPYPLSADLKPFFLLFQTVFLAFFLFQLKTATWSKSLNWFRNLFAVEVFVTAVIFALFFLYQFSLATDANTIFITDGFWMAAFIIGPVFLSFLFALKLQEGHNRAFSAVFLLIGLSLVSAMVSAMYFWPQTFFHFVLPTIVDVGGRLTATLFMLGALFLAALVHWRKGLTHENILPNLRKPAFFLAVFAVVLPVFLEFYKEGLFNMVIRAVVYWGLGYSGSGWFFASLYLLALIVYLQLIYSLRMKINDSLGSRLVLLGAASLPWNGIFIFNIGYSAIPGLMLSLDAIIIGFSLRKGDISSRSGVAG